jgi:hypothetical protein
MKVTDKLKQIIFKRLYKELGNAEIIPYNGSIWFIDREEKYWYFDFENSGALYWRYGFFSNFFEMFSLEHEDFEPILASWVEEVLNHKVSTTSFVEIFSCGSVEEVLNHKVDTTSKWNIHPIGLVEEVLNHKVFTKIEGVWRGDELVEEILDSK